MAMRRVAFSAVTGVRPERVRNDMVDMTFVAYATYFDGVMSSDKNVNRIYEETCAVLTVFFKAKVPAVDALAGLWTGADGLTARGRAERCNGR